jgi:hypothetical protein
MPVSTDPSRLGQIEIAGDAYALFLKVFANEVLAAFRTATVTEGRLLTRTITSGRSAQFPVLGKAFAGYHIPGTNLLDSTNTTSGRAEEIPANEVVIQIDSLLTSSTFVDRLDELMNHYDVRQMYANELGNQLAYKQDQQALQLVVLGARAAANIVDPGALGRGTPAGTVLSSADLLNDWTDDAELDSAIQRISVALDVNDAPKDNRFLFVTPGDYYRIMSLDNVVNYDHSSKSVGDRGKGIVSMVYGLQVLATNHLPQAVIAADLGTRNTYDGDFSVTQACAMQMGGVGLVRLMNMAMESEYRIEYQGTLMVAKYAQGLGFLRPESCVEVETGI